MITEAYGYKDVYEAPQELGGAIPARITAVFKGLFEIVCEHGSALARLKASEYYAKGETAPTVGDFVLLEYRTDGESRILKTLPRKTYFARLDPSSSGHAQQAVAANFDYVFILQSLNGDFNAQRLERYVALAWQSGAVPAVILTKADLSDNAALQISIAQKTAAGVGVFAVSSVTGSGLSELADYLKPGKTIVLLGSSGVGKSTLVNALANEEIMLTGEIREDDSRGRHTTTHRQLIMLKNGVMIIDTPGMRELGIASAEEGIEQGFADVEHYFLHCKYRNCSHDTEPGCAVKAAIESGELTQRRWQSYLKLSAEARHAVNKDIYKQMKLAKEKDISRKVRQLKQDPTRIKY